MMFQLPQQVRHNKEGFETWTLLHQKTTHCFLDDVEIDMSKTTWLDADACAIFGALLYNLGENLNNIRLTGIPNRIKQAISKNGFLSHYGHEKIPDSYGTTISYQRFDVGDDRYFSGYIEEEFINRPEIPTMSTGLLKRFRESIFEIFSNAVLHSNTKSGIFSCGQFFPSRKQLDFTVADLGVGIRENVRNHQNSDLMAAEEAIDWATQEGNTTKTGNVPGGLGLKLLCEFIDLNSGCIQIVSDSGYWKRKNRETEKIALENPFPGTIVSLEINTADNSSYALQSELTEKDIF